MTNNNFRPAGSLLTVAVRALRGMSNNNDREMDSLFFYILAGDVWSREGIESGQTAFCAQPIGEQQLTCGPIYTCLSVKYI